MRQRHAILRSDPEHTHTHTHEGDEILQKCRENMDSKECESAAALHRAAQRFRTNTHPHTHTHAKTDTKSREIDK